MFLVGSMWCASQTIARVMWRLWIVAGGGNANFFYFQTVFFNGASLFFVLDAVAAMRATSLGP